MGKKYVGKGFEQKKIIMSDEYGIMHKFIIYKQKYLTDRF